MYPSLEPSPNLYVDRRVALLTQHGKEAVLGEVLGEALACKVERIEGFDTDTLGTFTRDTARVGNQLEAARRKARIGMQLSGLPIGLASEGSFGPDPVTYMMSYNRELLVWIDDDLGIEVIATVSGRTNFASALVASWAEAKHFAERVGFPQHYLVVRPQHQDYPVFRKGLSDWLAFEHAVAWAMAVAENAQVFIETDMRAFANPSRMETIRLAAQELAIRLTSYCPVCRAPGFARAEVVKGLPCENCGMPTAEIKADLLRCVRCGHQQQIERARQYANAGQCHLCNP